MRPRDLLGQRDHPTRILDDLLAFYADLPEYGPDFSVARQYFIQQDLIDEDRIDHYVKIGLLELDSGDFLRLAPLGIALLGPFAHPRIIDHCTDYIEDLVQVYRDDIEGDADEEITQTTLADAEDIEQIGILIRDGQPQEAVAVYKKLDTGVREGIDDHLLLSLLFWFDPEQEEHERREIERRQHLQDLVNQHGLNPFYTPPTNG